VSHPSELIRGSKGDDLEGKRIIYCVTGSIASIESVRIIRELIRYGADVIPFMTSGALKIIGEEALYFASGHKPIFEFTGETEHIKYVKHADLIIIAPATANIIGKIANGIADDVVSTAALVALGAQMKMIVVPVMDYSMLQNPIVKENIEKLKKMGVKIIEPKIEEGKAKIPEKETIVKEVIREIGKRDFEGKNILILSGATAEPIDEIRIITNRSSGVMGYWIAKRAFLRGANVDMIYGLGKVDPSFYATVYRVETVDEMLAKAMDLLQSKKYDVVISVAAISDYKPKKREKGKIPSKLEHLTLELEPTQKVIEKIREVYDGVLVIFKSEAYGGEKLIKEAKKRLSEVKADIAVANTLEAFSSEYAEAYIINKHGEVREIKDHKKKIAEEILNEIARILQS